MNNLTIAKIFIVLFVVILSACKTEKAPETLKEALKNDFYIGVAINEWQTTGDDSLTNATIVNNFSSIVAENCMKSGSIQPREGVFKFEKPDEFVDFGEKNGMFIIGHCLVWHSQAPRWFFTDSTGNMVSRETMIERMKTHISTVVGRYKGRVNGWDVVNEAFNDDGTLRNTFFKQIIGDDYLKIAFQLAHEADPDAELYYNDYNTFVPEKRDAIYNFVKELQSEGIQVDGIGMQAHITMTFPKPEEMEAAIEKFSELAQVHITEMDMTVLPWPSERLSADIGLNYAADPKWNPYPVELSDSASVAWTNRFMDFFNVFLRHSDKIKRVTIWGLNDAQTWRNDWPIRGRKDYPVLFNRQNQPKPIVAEIIKAATEK